MALTSLVVVMSYLLTINTVQGAPYMEFLNITTAETPYENCISDSEAAVEYSQPVIITCFASCASGPYNIEHYKPGFLYWPRIKYRSCDGLMCSNSPKQRCMATKSRQRCQTVCVYKCDVDGCTFSGIQSVTYTEDLSCHCECGILGECFHRYTWDPQQCKCTKNKGCHREFYFNSILHQCLPKDDEIVIDYY